MQTKIQNRFFDLPEMLKQHIYEFDPTYKNIYNTSLKEISISVRTLQILLRQTSKNRKNVYGRNVLDYFHEEYNYKFQGIEYSTIKYFDCPNIENINNVEQIFNVSPHLKEIKESDENPDDIMPIYISCKCKFLTPENKIIYLFLLVDEVAYYPHLTPNKYNIGGFHIFPCKEQEGLPKININTHFWSDMIKKHNGHYSNEIVLSKDNETIASHISKIKKTIILCNL